MGFKFICRDLCVSSHGPERVGGPVVQAVPQVGRLYLNDGVHPALQSALTLRRGPKMNTTRFMAFSSKTSRAGIGYIL